MKLLNIAVLLAGIYGVWNYASAGNHAAAFAWAVITLNAVTDLIRVDR